MVLALCMSEWKPPSPPPPPSTVILTPGSTVVHRDILKLLGVVDALSASHTKKNIYSPECRDNSRRDSINRRNSH